MCLYNKFHLDLDYYIYHHLWLIDNYCECYLKCFGCTLDPVITREKCYDVIIIIYFFHVIPRKPYRSSIIHQQSFRFASLFQSNGDYSCKMYLAEKHIEAYHYLKSESNTIQDTIIPLALRSSRPIHVAHV